MRTFASLLKGSTPEKSFGEVAEWSIAAVLKTVVPRGTRGSNPCLSAINAENQQIAKQIPSFTPKNVKLGVFVLFKKLCGTLAMKSNIATHSMRLAMLQTVSMFG